MASIFGKNIKISLFGQSHGGSIGVVMDNVPHGIKLDYDFIKSEIKRRISNEISTQRKEEDDFKILSGVIEDTTTGEPLCAVFENKKHISEDYNGLKDTPRPSHADYPASIRFDGFNDIRGGGHFSGRLTAPLVFASSVAKIILKKKYSIEVHGYVKQIGSVCEDYERINDITLDDIIKTKKRTIPVFSDETELRMIKEVLKIKEEGDSVGGIVSVCAFGVDVGWGEPYFDSIESRMSEGLFAIGAVKGVEFGKGFSFASMKGSEANDVIIKTNGKIRTKTNNNGGINGGITNGMPIVVSVALKPTPSIYIKQKTLNVRTGEEDELVIKGRHDTCIAIRAGVILEGVVALTLLDVALDMYGRKRNAGVKI